jgi:hypothetical protein
LEVGRGQGERVLSFKFQVSSFKVERSTFKGLGAGMTELPMNLPLLPAT